MADLIDKAGDHIEKELERRITAVRQVEALPLPEVCDNECVEKPAAASRYCSRDCRDDHEARLAQIKRQGRRG